MLHVTLWATRNKTMQLRDREACHTLLRRTILVKLNFRIHVSKRNFSRKIVDQIPVSNAAAAEFLGDWKAHTLQWRRIKFRINHFISTAPTRAWQQTKN